MKRPARGLRLDIIRGWLQIPIFGAMVLWAVTAGLGIGPAAWWLDPLPSVAGAAILVGHAMAAERRRHALAPASR